MAKKVVKVHIKTLNGFEIHSFHGSHIFCTDRGLIFTFSAFWCSSCLIFQDQVPSKFAWNQVMKQTFMSTWALLSTSLFGPFEQMLNNIFHKENAEFKEN